MTPGFDKVIRRYMKRYNVSYSQAASELSKRKQRKKKEEDIPVKKTKELKQPELSLDDKEIKYGDGI